MKYEDLIRVQRMVNSQVEYETDQDNFGERERWEVAQTKGDCEDIALRKMHELLNLGWNVQYLRLTFCYIGRRAANTGHCVLVVEFNDQLFVLDNRAYDVYTVPENDNYIWNSCQEFGGSQNWVSCEEVFSQFYD